jgi:hypothetical protein
MSSQAGFVTKNGNLSAKALIRIFKDGVMPKKSAKKAKVVKAEPTEAPEEKNEEIMDLNITRTSEEELEKRRRLSVAVENYFESGATAKELLAAHSDENFKRAMKIFAENQAAGMYRPTPTLHPPLAGRPLSAHGGPEKLTKSGSARIQSYARLLFHNYSTLRYS